MVRLIGLSESHTVLLNSLGGATSQHKYELNINTDKHPYNSLFSRTTLVNWHQKGF